MTRQVDYTPGALHFLFWFAVFILALLAFEKLGELRARRRYERLNRKWSALEASADNARRESQQREAALLAQVPGAKTPEHQPMSQSLVEQARALGLSIGDLN